MIGLNYIAQHNKTTKNFNTGLVIIDRDFRFLDGMNISGIFLYDDYGGGLNNLLSANAALEYSIQIDRRHIISLALQSGYISSSTKPNDFHNRFNPEKNVNQGDTLKFTSKLFDLSAGLLLYSRDYFFGVSFYHINTPIDKSLPNGNNKVPFKFSGQIGTYINIRKRLKVIPSIVYQYQKEHLYLSSINDYLIEPLNDLTFSLDLFNDTLRFGIGYHYLLNMPEAYFAKVGIVFGAVEIVYEYGFSPYVINQNKMINSFHNIGLDIRIRSKRLTGKFAPMGCPSF